VSAPLETYCTKCGKPQCQHGGWTSRTDEALMRRALEALENLIPKAPIDDCPCGENCPWNEGRHAIAALTERLLTE